MPESNQNRSGSPAGNNSTSKDRSAARSDSTVRSSQNVKGGTSESSHLRHKSDHRSKSSDNDSREKSRTIISYIFSFVLSLFVLLGTVCIVVLACLFSEGFFFNVIEDDYYESVLSEVVTAAEDYTIPAEFDISVLDGVFTVSDVRRDVNGYITAAFRGYNYKPDMQSQNSELYANVSNFIAENNVPVEGDQESVISAYVEEIDNIYLDKVTIPGINLIEMAREKVKGFITVALILLFAFSLILCVVLIRLYRYPHQGARFIAYSAGGCTLMSFVLPFYFYLSKVYERVQISPEYFYRFVTSYIRHILFSFMQASLIWLILTIACVVFVYLSKNNMLGGKLRKKLMRKIGSLQRRH